MKKSYGILIVLLSFIAATSLNAQTTFQLELNSGAGDDAIGIVENSQGNYVAAGYTYSGSNFDIVITEVSPAGLVLQTRTFVTTSNEIVKSITATSDGGYFITGSVYTNPSDYDALIIKLDAGFNTVFYKRYGYAGGNDNGNRGFEISPGRYGLLGSIGLAGSTKPAMIVFNDSGLVVHEGYLSTNQFASPDYGGQFFNNGTGGITHLTNGLTIMDTLGNVVGSWSSNTAVFTTDVIRRNDGAYVTVGVDNYGGPTGGTLAVGIIDSGLTTLLGGTKFRVSGSDLSPAAIRQSSDGYFYIAANSSSLSTGNLTPVLIKTDAQGNLIWSKSYKPGSVPSAAFNHLSLSSDGGILLAGNMGPWNNQHMFLVKVDSSGYSPCNTSTFPLTVQAPVATTRTLHSPYSGNISSLSNSAFTNQSLTLVENLLCSSNPGTGILDVNPNLGYSLFPLPMKDEFKISGGTGGEILLQVFNSSGAMISQQIVTNSQSISSRDWNCGMYFLRLLSPETGVPVMLKALKL